MKILQDQADALREILRVAGDHPSKCHCCVAKPQIALGVTFGSILRVVFSLLGFNRHRSSMSERTSSKAAVAYTPAPNGTLGASSSTIPPTSGTASAHGLALYNGTKRTSQTQGCSSMVPSPTILIAPTRIIFGIQGVRKSLEIEQIEISGQMNDQIFFSELKTRYKKHCSFFRRFFSPLRFQHCDFVKVRLLKRSFNNNRTDCASSRSSMSIESFLVVRAFQTLMGLPKTMTTLRDTQQQGYH